MTAAARAERAPHLGPSVLEILGVQVALQAVNFLAWILVRQAVTGTAWAPLGSMAYALLGLALSLLWYRWRVAPALPPQERPVLRWVPGSTRPFLRWGILLVVLFGAVQLSTTDRLPPHLLHPLALVAQLVHMGLVVGLAEEAQMRLALHLPLKRRWPAHFRLGRFTISAATLVAAVIFGAWHLPTYLYVGDSVAVSNAIAAGVIGFLIGLYYDRTENYLGTAFLHNLGDLTHFAVIVGLTFLG